MNRNLRNILLPAALFLMVFVSLAQAGQILDARKFLVCHASGVTSREEAQPYIDGFGAYLAKKLSWQPDSYQVQFENNRRSGVKALESFKPAFAAMTLGMYLENEKKFNLKPLVMARVGGKNTNKYRVLVKKGQYASLDALKGKMLVGNELEDPVFLSKVVFAGKIDAASHFKLSNTKRPLRAIRKVSRGKADAALVDGSQFESLKSLPMFNELQVVYESEELPNLGLAYVDGRAKPAEVDAFRSALIGMCKDPDGAKICETFKLGGFEAASSAMIEKVRAMYNK